MPEDRTLNIDAITRIRYTGCVDGWAEETEEPSAGTIAYMLGIGFVPRRTMAPGDGERQLIVKHSPSDDDAPTHYYVEYDDGTSEFWFDKDDAARISVEPRDPPLPPPSPASAGPAPSAP